MDMFAGSSLMKIVYRSKENFCDGEPLKKEVRQFVFGISVELKVCMKLNRTF